MNVNLNNTDNNDYVRGYKDGKKAGMSAEHDRAQVLVDALKYIQKYYDTKDIWLSMYAATVIKEYEQWKSGKGKEVGDEM